MSNGIHETTEAQPQTRLIPVNAWKDYHPYPSTASLRNLIFHGRTNGFDACIRRVGRRVLIKEDAFFAWVDQQDAKTRGGDQ
jgi:hypothetical protein